MIFSEIFEQHLVKLYTEKRLAFLQQHVQDIAKKQEALELEIHQLKELICKPV